MGKAKIIAMANQKGGVGKTTSTINIAVGLTRENKKVLVVDLDPQSNLTMGFGFDPDKLEYTINECIEPVMNNQAIIDIDQFIIKTGENVDLIASDPNLTRTEVAIQSMSVGREHVVKKILALCTDRYDYILIDCPPSLGTLTINALTAADEVIIPTQAQIFSFKGSSLLLENITMVQELSNPKLRIGGILITMVNARSKNAQSIMDDIKEIYGEHVRVFDNFIPQSVKASESNDEGVSIYMHDPKGKISSAYDQCVKEILNG